MTNDWQAELAKFVAEDAAADAVIAEFKALGRSHAAFAIDCRADYDNAQASFEQNLYDTLAEQHKYLAPFIVDICVDAYNAAWKELVK